MPPVAPIKRKDLIAYLRQLGFMGPFPGSNHDFMQREAHRIRIPNPHRGDIGREFLLRILKQAEISREEWEKL